ncbi:hypothetical protein IPA_02110 [Ignicoccus pacificus DSM 13166]|uniref:HEPN domain-containing protein n=1 Tax=Ignicoccus pacificus DSM 13166 TaxID=940294 RepID=A0A977KAQ8_9CREN|nr:hypothetical protein IPA_02110 [Ignicoccus pacificus DSM 13166]
MKGLLLKYFGKVTKDHNLGKLFGLLIKELVKVGMDTEELYEFSRNKRSYLQMLEEAYYLGRA